MVHRVPMNPWALGFQILTFLLFIAVSDHSHSDSNIPGIWRLQGVEWVIPHARGLGKFIVAGHETSASPAAPRGYIHLRERDGNGQYLLSPDRGYQWGPSPGTHDGDLWALRPHLTASETLDTVVYSAVHSETGLFVRAHLVSRTGVEPRKTLVSGAKEVWDLGIGRDVIYTAFKDDQSGEVRIRVNDRLSGRALKDEVLGRVEVLGVRFNSIGSNGVLFSEVLGEEEERIRIRVRSVSYSVVKDSKGVREVGEFWLTKTEFDKGKGIQAVVPPLEDRTAFFGQATLKIGKRLIRIEEGGTSFETLVDGSDQKAEELLKLSSGSVFLRVIERDGDSGVERDRIYALNKRGELDPTTATSDRREERVLRMMEAPFSSGFGRQGFWVIRENFFGGVWRQGIRAFQDLIGDQSGSKISFEIQGTDVWEFEDVLIGVSSNSIPIVFLLVKNLDQKWYLIRWLGGQPEVIRFDLGAPFNVPRGLVGTLGLDDLVPEDLTVLDPHAFAMVYESDWLPVMAVVSMDSQGRWGIRSRVPVLRSHLGPGTHAAFPTCNDVLVGGYSTGVGRLTTVPIHP